MPAEGDERGGHALCPSVAKLVLSIPSCKYVVMRSEMNGSFCLVFQPAMVVVVVVEVVVVIVVEVMVVVLPVDEEGQE